MGFLDFNLITDPPSDEFVDEETQLNDNWRELELKLSWLQGKIPSLPGGADDLEIGVEGRINTRHAAWNGTAWRVPDDFQAAWSSWNTISPASPFVIRTGYPMKYRTNTVLRKVQLIGNLINTISASPWPKTVWNPVSTNGIPSTFQPVGGIAYSNVATSVVPSGTAGIDVAAGRIRVQPNGTNPLKVDVHWMGQDGGGNYVELSGVEWYY